MEQLQSYLSRTTVAYQKEIMRLRGVVASLDPDQVSPPMGFQSQLAEQPETRQSRSAGNDGVNRAPVQGWRASQDSSGGGGA